MKLVPENINEAIKHLAPRPEEELIGYAINKRNGKTVKFDKKGDFINIGRRNDDHSAGLVAKLPIPPTQGYDHITPNWVVILPFENWNFGNNMYNINLDYRLIAYNISYDEFVKIAEENDIEIT